MKSGDNILIYRVGSLGDAIIALPCFHLIREAFPVAHITLLANRPVNTKAAPLAAVLGENGYFFNDVIEYPLYTRSPRILWDLAKNIRNRSIDTLINLAAARTRRSTIRDELFFRFAGIKRQIGSPKNRQDFKVERETDDGRYEWEAHRLLRRISAIGTVDLADPSSWDLRISELELAAGGRFFGDKIPEKLLSVCLGTKVQAKDWEERNWMELLRLVAIALPDWGLVMVGAEDEVERSNRCAAVWTGRVFNFCGKTTPRESAAIISYTRAFIGHDSGPMHLAAAMGVPCIAIFAARNPPGQWFPCGESNEILYHQTECFGCKLVDCIKEKKRCILSISVDEVYNAVLRVVQND